MKKIAIITFHASHNNGSMLQALALQTVIQEKYKNSVEIIDYSNEGQRNMYAPIPKPHNWKQLIKKFMWMTNHRQLQQQYDAYEAFSKKYFNLSIKRYKESSELGELELEYDAFIAGSDQVWNIKCIDADDAYYLNFIHNKPCFAYAVSFGANNPFENDATKYKKYINKFVEISVRENNAKQWIKEYADRNVQTCLDPTMLLDKEQWERVVEVEKEPIIRGDYIYYYCFSINEQVQKFLKYLSKKMNMPVYFMEAKEWTLKMCWRNGIHLIKKYGPDVYMNVVKNAKLFITTSFHGTAFATIYRKNFWYIRSNESETSKDDRATTFLQQLDLMTRYKTVDELKEIDLYKPIDYEKVDSKLYRLRQESLQYLDKIMEEI